MAAGTRNTSSRSAQSAAASAMAMCPRWMGSKVPPTTPILIGGACPAAGGAAVSRLILELELADPDRVSRLRPGLLERSGSADPVQHRLESLQAVVGVQVRALDQTVHRRPTKLETPGAPLHEGGLGAAAPPLQADDRRLGLEAGGRPRGGQPLAHRGPELGALLAPGRPE